MKTISFRWDQQKATENRRRQKVSFEEAQTVFTDPNARMIFDPDHLDREDRFIILGISSALRLLVVVIRIISARKATKQEKNQYGGFYHEK